MIFSGAFSPLSPARVSRVCPKVFRVSQSEKGRCFLFLLSHSKKKKKKHPKQTNKKTPPKPTLGCLGHRPAVSQGSQGRLQTAWPPAATATRPHPRRCLLRPRRLHHCHLQAFTHRVSRPTGGIRNSKCSKQFQHIQYTCWDFSMIHGQIKFSTSHTFKEEKHENDLSFKI